MIKKFVKVTQKAFLKPCVIKNFATPSVGIADLAGAMAG